jgi:hypothetical protein
MAKNIQERVTDSFAKSDRDDVREYLTWLRSSIGDNSQSVRRLVLFILLLIAAFELVSESPVISVTLGTFRIYRGSIVAVFIPALVSYLYLQCQIETAHLGLMQRTFSRVFQLWTPEAEANDLDKLARPGLPLFWNLDPNPRQNLGLADKLQYLLGGVFFLLIFLGTAIFELRAYYLLSRPPFAHHALWSVSAAFSAFCYFAALTYAYLDINSKVRR